MPHFSTDAEIRGQGMRRQAPRTGGRGRMPYGRGLGPGGTCFCPRCGIEIAHKIGKPCYLIPCPTCRTMMRRG